VSITLKGENASAFQFFFRPCHCTPARLPRTEGGATPPIAQKRLLYAGIFY